MITQKKHLNEEGLFEYAKHYCQHEILILDLRGISECSDKHAHHCSLTRAFIAAFYNRKVRCRIKPKFVCGGFLLGPCFVMQYLVSLKFGIISLRQSELVALL